jgi:hypothetical protein
MTSHINNKIKNESSFIQIDLDENIAKKHSTKTDIGNKVFLNKNIKKQVFKSELYHNIVMSTMLTPNFALNFSLVEDLEKNIDQNSIENISVNYKYCIYNEYFLTYNAIKNIFDNT